MAMSGAGRRVWVASVLVAVGLAPLAAGPAHADVERVALGQFRFTPPRVEIAMGDSVIWEAADEGHTVTARDGSFDSSPRGLMAEGDQYRYRFKLPGTFTYFCRVHQARGMVGEIVVVDPSAPAPTTTTRLTPVSAPATTASTDTTATTAPVTTTSRPLATSSTTSMSIATATTAPPGAPASPQEAPVLNPNARVVGSPPLEAGLPEAQAAARRSGDSGGPNTGLVLGLVAVATVGLAGGGALLGSKRRSGQSRRRPPR
jgi:plastocyanin